MKMKKIFKTALSVEQISELIFHNLEYRFQEKMRGPEKKEKEEKRKNFFKKVGEHCSHNLIKNDRSIPIIDFESFLKIINELDVFSVLGIEEKAVAEEMATEIFFKWYDTFFPKNPYQVFWNMVISAECLAEKNKISVTEMVAEMFPVSAPSLS